MELIAALKLPIVTRNYAIVLVCPSLDLMSTRFHVMMMSCAAEVRDAATISHLPLSFHSILARSMTYRIGSSPYSARREHVQVSAKNQNLGMTPRRRAMTGGIQGLSLVV